MKRRIAAILLFAVIISVLSGCKTMNHQPFANNYTIPETPAVYTRIDTAPKTDWTANYIWDASDGREENVWMCFRKTVELSEVPASLTAFLSADSKYWLYINGKTAVFEGGVKRGPTPDGSYFDAVEIAPFLNSGKNVICALVWYWGKDKSFSNTGSGKAGFLFEAGKIRSDSSWKVCRNTAYQKDPGLRQPNYRLPESNIYYDAREEIGDWLSADYDDSSWEYAKENGTGGCAPWGTLFPRGIPLLKDYGLRDYENAGDYKDCVMQSRKSITLDIPYNAQCTPYLKIEAAAGKKIKIRTENTKLGSVRDTYITRDGVQSFEALGWFNGEHITYEIPAGVRILELKYRETGYDTAFSGLFRCSDEALNTLWQKSMRTLYVTMRDNYMDCPDRERAQWWGDVTNEMAMTMYALDANACLLYQKGVASMLGHIDPETNVLQTVVPTSRDYYELPAQQLAGVCGFWTYYLYTGDRDFLASVYDAAVRYVGLWTIGENNLVDHRGGSWDWMDWGSREDVAAMENAWYYYALSCIRNMADVLGKETDDFSARMERIRTGYASFWTENGYKSSSVLKPDDRANALAVLSGLADEDKFDVITKVLTKTKNASPYMEYYVLEALCRMERYDAAKQRMLQRYGNMIRADYSTLWEHWKKILGTLNHAWSGGPLVILSKYVAGVRPTEPGYAGYMIRPQLSEPDKVECVVPSVKGYIRVTETKTDRAFTLDAVLPKGATAQICMPYADGQTVRYRDAVIYQNGRFTKTDGITFVTAEDGFVVFSVTPSAEMTLHLTASDD